MNATLDFYGFYGFLDDSKLIYVQNWSDQFEYLMSNCVLSIVHVLALIGDCGISVFHMDDQSNLVWFHGLFVFLDDCNKYGDAII